MFMSKQTFAIAHPEEGISPELKVIVDADGSALLLIREQVGGLYGETLASEECPVGDLYDTIRALCETTGVGFDLDAIRYYDDKSSTWTGEGFSPDVLARALRRVGLSG